MPKLSFIMHRCLHFFLCVTVCLSCLLSLSLFASAQVSDNAEEWEALYGNGGFYPDFPLDGFPLRVTSTDYYYEDKDDPLPGLHGGMDITVDMKTEVKAIADGTVYEKGYKSDYGNYVILCHQTENGIFYSRYAHLYQYTVGTDETVVRGQKIGLSGNSGQSTAPHLHLEIYRSEKVDRTERSRTVKYYLSEGTDALSKMRFYIQPISGIYNCQDRISVLGAGGSCQKRCGLTVPHNHISAYAFYIMVFYQKGSTFYTFDAMSEARLFPDEAVKTRIYASLDRDGDGHLSLSEATAYERIDLKGLSEPGEGVLALLKNAGILYGTEPEPAETELTVSLILSKGVALPDGGLCGIWQFIDEPYLNVRSGPGTSYPTVGKFYPYSPFRVTETAVSGGYTWGKTVCDGKSGWCVIANEWSEQCVCAKGDYYTDESGRLCLCDTQKPVVLTLRGTDSLGEALLDALTLDLTLPAGKCLAYRIGSDGNGVLIYPSDKEKASFYFPELQTKDVSVTLYAVPSSVFVAGDVNGNGKVGEEDMIRLIRLLSGWRDAALPSDRADIDGNGILNLRDAIALAQLLASR